MWHFVHLQIYRVIYICCIGLKVLSHIFFFFSSTKQKAGCWHRSRNHIHRVHSHLMWTSSPALSPLRKSPRICPDTKSFADNSHSEVCLPMAPSSSCCFYLIQDEESGATHRARGPQRLTEKQPWSRIPSPPPATYCGSCHLYRGNRSGKIIPPL